MRHRTTPLVIWFGGVVGFAAALLASDALYDGTLAIGRAVLPLGLLWGGVPLDWPNVLNAMLVAIAIFTGLLAWRSALRLVSRETAAEILATPDGLGALRRRSGIRSASIVLTAGVIVAFGAGVLLDMRHGEGPMLLFFLSAGALILAPTIDTYWREPFSDSRRARAVFDVALACCFIIPLAFIGFLLQIPAALIFEHLMPEPRATSARARMAQLPSVQ